jgi:hypothetical protein
MIFFAASPRRFLRQPDIKGVISICLLRLIVPEPDAENLAVGSYAIPGE